MLDKNVITNFGIPDCLKSFDIRFCFTDSFADELVGCGCHCDTYSTKFFLYDSFNAQSVFTMDFYITEGPISPLSKIKISGQRVHLQHIATRSLLRGKGIASFYIANLINLCKIHDIHIITLDVCPDFNDMENALNANELTKFYNSFSTDEVKIIII